MCERMVRKIAPVAARRCGYGSSVPYNQGRIGYLDVSRWARADVLRTTLDGIEKINPVQKGVPIKLSYLALSQQLYKKIKGCQATLLWE